MKRTVWQLESQNGKNWEVTEFFTRIGNRILIDEQNNRYRAGKMIMLDKLPKLFEDTCNITLESVSSSVTVNDSDKLTEIMVNNIFK